MIVRRGHCRATHRPAQLTGPEIRFRRHTFSRGFGQEVNMDLVRAESGSLMPQVSKIDAVRI